MGRRGLLELSAEVGDALRDVDADVGIGRVSSLVVRCDSLAVEL